jgi:hypothetical protein
MVTARAYGAPPCPSSRSRIYPTSASYMKPTMFDPEGAHLVPVTRGQKRVEDARRRAYDPRVHRSWQKLFSRRMDCQVKPGNDA